MVAPLALRFPGVVAAVLDADHEVELHCTEHVRHTHRYAARSKLTRAPGSETCRISS